MYRRLQALAVLLLLSVPVVAQEEGKLLFSVPVKASPENDQDPPELEPPPADAGQQSEDDLIAQDIASEQMLREQFAQRIRAAIQQSDLGLPPEQPRRIQAKRNRLLRRFDRNRWARERSIDVGISAAFQQGLLSVEDLQEGQEVFAAAEERDWAAFFEQLISFITRLIELFSSFAWQPVTVPYPFANVA